MVPSKKRTHVGRPKPLYVEKLMRDLCTILHEQQSYFSASSEEDLLFESDTPMVSVEIGHGSILIRHPSSIARDEEFEASTLSLDNKQCLMNEAYSFSSTIPMYSDCNNMNFSSHRVEKIKNLVGQIMQQEKLERHKNKSEVNRKRELRLIEQQEELQARLVNLNIGPQEPMSNYPISNYYANSYPATSISKESTVLGGRRVNQWRA
ncbi:hypothetical protein JHK86_004788 [Glycine max]|nr:hypothetical protein JHK86_004788 [Glycine max]